MKIIIIDKARGVNEKGGYHARLFGSMPIIQSFAKSELKALQQLYEKLLEKSLIKTK